MALIPKNNELVNILDGVLEESGFKEPTTELVAQQDAKSILNRKKATLENTLDNLVFLMNMAETESVRLKAVENALAIHGVDLKSGPSTQNNTQVNFVFQEVGPGMKEQFERVLCPERG